MHKIFLLSPAHAGGKRARMLIRPQSHFDLASRLRTSEGASLGEIFSFVSGLYFRGKLAYAIRFGAAPPGIPAAYAITSNRGLVDVQKKFHLESFESFSQTEIDGTDPEYRLPLKQGSLELKRRLAPSNYRIILLGSIATGKYVDVLTEIFGANLFFPIDFVGRGDMSRGGLMLRCVTSGEELVYAPVAEANRHGKRPPKLAPLPNKSFS